MSKTTRLLLALYFLAAPVVSFSQVIGADIYDNRKHYPVTKYTAYFRSKTPVSIDSVVKSPASFVQSENKPVLIFNYDPYYYWFRIVVKNDEPADRQLMLLMAPFGLYEGILYQKKNGRWDTVAATGLKYNFKDRSYQFTHHVFPFLVAAGNTDTLYLQTDAKNVYKSFGFAILNPKDLKVFENKIYFIFGIIVGLLILFFLLNLSLYFALKEKIHLWYAFYIALLFLIVMKNDLLDQQFLGLDSERGFRLTPYLAIGALAISVLLHVVQLFLKTVLLSNKKLYRLTTLLKVNVLLSAACHAVVFNVAEDYRVHMFFFVWAKMSTLLGICVIIVNCIYSIRKGFRGAWFIIFGSLVFMLGSVQRLFYASTLSFLFPPTTFHIGIIVETFVISMALIYRFWSEKEAQRQRANQIESQTLQDVSEEIHDSVSQELTLANLHLKSADTDSNATRQPGIREAVKLVSSALASLRSLSRDMKDDFTARTDIRERIQAEFTNLEKTQLFKVHFTSTGVPFVFENRKQAILIRVVKEIIHNMIKHSQASAVEAELVFEKSRFILKIKDNGKGFDLVTAQENSNGLKNIQTRCRLIKASCTIKSEPGSGTAFTISMDI